jgi:ADP-ribosylglycohydrolase
MLGAIFGDIVGSVYEYSEDKPDFNFQLITKHNHFTDDTVLTLALADSIITGENLATKFRQYYFRYPDKGYGSSFHKWARTPLMGPYNSWGNGSAMRVSPVGWAYDDLDTVLLKAKESAEVTHNHPEGIKGAQATAASIFLSRKGSSKAEIKLYIEKKFGYSLDLSLDDLRKHYRFDISCQGTVPQAIFTFLISDNFEDSIRKAIYIGGDSDTLACINGSIAEAFYGIDEAIKTGIESFLDDRLKKIIKTFRDKFLNH